MWTGVGKGEVIRRYPQRGRYTIGGIVHIRSRCCGIHPAFRHGGKSYPPRRDHEFIPVAFIYSLWIRHAKGGKIGKRVVGRLWKRRYKNRSYQIPRKRPLFCTQTNTLNKREIFPFFKKKSILMIIHGGKGWWITGRVMVPERISREQAVLRAAGKL